MKNILRWILALLLAVAPVRAQTVTTPQQVAIVCAFNTTVPTLVTGNYGLVQCDSAGQLSVASSPYPAGATSLQNSSGNAANAVATANLTSATGRTVFLAGVEFTASGATAASVVIATITGLLGGTRRMIFVFPAGATIAATPLIIPFNPPLPASGTGVNLAISLPAGGSGNTNAVASAYGYLL